MKKNLYKINKNRVKRRKREVVVRAWSSHIKAKKIIGV